MILEWNRTENLIREMSNFIYTNRAYFHSKVLNIRGSCLC
jgi:hypothetical protein